MKTTKRVCTGVGAIAAVACLVALIFSGGWVGHDWLPSLLRASVAEAAATSNHAPDLAAGNRFWVYRDTFLNSWIPGNWMPAESAKIIRVFDPACADQPKSGTSCLHVRIEEWSQPYWAGVACAVPNPEDVDKPYWGETEAGGWDLRGAKRVVFWARSPSQSRIQFKACIMGDKPYGDSQKRPAATSYITLTPDWQEYSIDVGNADLSRVVTGFCFVTSRDAQSEPNKAIDFYLDEIYWEFPEKPAETTISSSASAPAAPEPNRFWVYADKNMNDWVPANWMPAEASKMVTFVPDSRDNPQSGENCIQVKIQEWQAPYWCGIGWGTLNPDDPEKAYWGETPAPGWDLSGAQRVVFWARAPRPCKVQFKAAFIGDKKYGDSSPFGPATEWTTLTPEWKEYAIGLKGVDLSRVVTGFCWVTNKSAQPHQNEPVEFFLDSVYWEGVSPAERKTR